ncbi:MAG: sulfatase-like hydrolase/transferase [Verrucomicrobiota bacterium]
MLPFLLFLGIFLTSTASSADRPNIVLIYLDDWAWNGTPVKMNDSMENSAMPILEMPNLERLAEDGMKFTNAYGSHQCAPARVSVQTGQSVPRHGLTLVLGRTKHDYYDMRPQYLRMPVIPTVAEPSLKADAVTIPKALAPLGYVSAHVGKWHMYSDPGDAGYVLHDGDTTNTPGNTVGKARTMPDDLTDPKLMFSMTDKAIGFMEEQVEAGNPFYLQISHYAMHEGRESTQQAREKYVNHPTVLEFYEEKGTSPDELSRKSDPANWFAMGDDLDRAIGMVLEAISDLGIEENTYVILVSDNGYRHKELLLTEGKVQPLHGSKWWLWEGGIRVPMIVKGPGIEPGSVFSANVINYDFLPTFFEWAGGDPDELEDIDGVSLARFLAGEKPDAAFYNRPLFFHLPHYRSEIPHSAIIAGNAKVMHFYERPDVPMLFNLREDPGESVNVARKYPETHQRLFDQMMVYLEEVGARFPKENPNYDPQEYQQMDKYDTFMAWGPFVEERPPAYDEK